MQSTSCWFHHGDKNVITVLDITSVFKSGRRAVSTLFCFIRIYTIFLQSLLQTFLAVSLVRTRSHDPPPTPLPYKYLWESEYSLSTLWSRGQQNLKTEIVNTLGFTGHLVTIFNSAMQCKKQP